MAPPKRPWFRLYTETIWDRKIRRLHPTHRWLWVALLALARQSPVPGYLLLGEDQALSWDDVADAAAIPVKDVEKGSAALAELGLIGFDQSIKAWFIPKWNDRQYESDETTKRVRKHRSKVNEATPMKRSIDADSPPDETHQIQRQITETDTEAEKPLAPVEPRRQDHLFESVAAVCDIDYRELTPQARGPLNVATKQLRDLNVTPDDVRERAANWPSLFPGATLTPTALAKHWPQLARERAPAPRRDRYVEMGQSLQHRVDQTKGGNGGQPRSALDQAGRGLSA